MKYRCSSRLFFVVAPITSASSSSCFTARASRRQTLGHTLQNAPAKLRTPQVTEARTLISWTSDGSSMSSCVQRTKPTSRSAPSRSIQTFRMRASGAVVCASSAANASSSSINEHLSSIASPPLRHLSHPSTSNTFFFHPSFAPRSARTNAKLPTPSLPTRPDLCPQFGFANATSDSAGHVDRHPSADTRARA